MTKSLYFHIDEVARDSVVAANLKKILAARGVELVYGNRWTSYVLRRQCPFDALVLPALMFVEDHFPDPSGPLPPIIVLPTEGIGGIPAHPKRAALKFIGQRFMAGDPRWAERVAAYALWGRQQMIGFEAFAPTLVPRCRIIGHPRFDRRCLGPQSPALRPADGRIRIGLQTRFSLLNPFDGRSMLMCNRNSRKSCYHHLQQEGSDLDVEDLFFVEATDMRVLFDFIDRIDPARQDVVLRVHPREDRNRWAQSIEQNRLPVTLGQWDQPFIHWLNEVDWTVSSPSTSFYDSFAVGKPAVCIGSVSPRRRAHVLPISDDTSPLLQHVRQPRSMDELMEIVSRMPDGPMTPSPEAAALLAHDAHYPHCAASLDALADLCLQVLDEAAEKPAVKWGTRAEYDQLAAQLAQELARHPVYSNEQGSTFRLSPERTAWIDALAAPQ